MTWTTHPAADLFPVMTDDELRELADDISIHGLIEPVWLCDQDGETLLLDGRNRVKACAMVGVNVTTRLADGDPIAFVVSANIHRRHLTTGQRGMLALALEDLYAREAQKRKAQAPGQPRGVKQLAVMAGLPPQKSRDMAAKMVGTSGRAVGQAKRVRDQAPDLAEKVRTGALPIDRADRIIRDRQAEQRRLSLVPALSLPVTADIRHGDFREVLGNVSSIDAIITDPPYAKAYLPLLADLAVWADKVLTEDGVLAVMMGQAFLPEVFRLLDGYRPYRWTMAVLTPRAGYNSYRRNVMSKWKPVLVYGGGPRFTDLVTSESSDGEAKSHDKWGQDLGAFETLVGRLTLPGQLVCDPFMGGGTTALACKLKGRNVIGCDVDRECVAETLKRLKAAGGKGSSTGDS